jgi:hypothetical protein
MVEPLAETICAAEYFDTDPDQWVVVEFLSGSSEIFTISNGKCHVFEPLPEGKRVTGEDVLNYLNRKGENFTKVITIP